VGGSSAGLDSGGENPRFLGRPTDWGIPDDDDDYDNNNNNNNNKCTYRTKVFLLFCICVTLGLSHEGKNTG
jgi:hypothetical protein